MFKTGDLVVLNSGGPTMTVAAVDSPEDGSSVYCTWMSVDSDDIYESDFVPATIKHVGTLTPDP